MARASAGQLTDQPRDGATWLTAQVQQFNVAMHNGDVLAGLTLSIFDEGISITAGHIVLPTIGRNLSYGAQRDTHCPTQPTLAELAASIKQAHTDVLEAHAYSAQRMLDAGQRLAEAKGRDDIPQGWARWVVDVGVPLRTAYRYVKLFHLVAEQAATVADIAEAGQEGAIELAKERAGEAEEDPADSTPDLTETMKHLAAEVRSPHGKENSSCRSASDTNSSTNSRSRPPPTDSPHPLYASLRPGRR